MLACASIGVRAAAAPPVPETSPAGTGAPNPDEIYVRAVRRERRAADEAPYVSYRVAYRGRSAELRCVRGVLMPAFDGRDGAATYLVAYDGRTGAAINVDLATGDRCGGTPLVTPSGGAISRLVVPGGAALPPEERADPDAVIVYGALHYRVPSAVLEPLDGASAYHLTLRATGDSARYPLTDLFVDPVTFDVRRVRAAFAETYRGGTAVVTGTGDFRRIGTAWVLVSARIDVAAAASPGTIAATLEADATDFAFSRVPPPELNEGSRS